jgi:hypothetical protein
MAGVVTTQTNTDIDRDHAASSNWQYQQGAPCGDPHPHTAHTFGCNAGGSRPGPNRSNANRINPDAINCDAYAAGSKPVGHLY